MKAIEIRPGVVPQWFLSRPASTQIMETSVGQILLETVVQVPHGDPVILRVAEAWANKEAIAVRFWEEDGTEQFVLLQAIALISQGDDVDHIQLQVVLPEAMVVGYDDLLSE